MSLWEFVAGVVLLFWLAIVADLRRWWPSNWRLHPTDDQVRRDVAKTLVTAIVPARNEAETLPETLPALLGQKETLGRVVVVDDRSSDGTGDLARRLGAEGEVLLTVVDAKDCPVGWTGKLNALQAGVEVVAAECESSERDGWYLFTDADILHPSDSVARLLACAQEGSYELVSTMVRLRANSFWERLLVPPFIYFFQLLYPFRRVSDPRSKVAAAAGGCVLIRASALVRAGGLEQIRDALIDDVALARTVKDAGGRCWLGIDPDMLSLRRYDTLGEFVNMVARTAFTELRYRYSMVLVTWLFLAFFFAGPPVLLGVSLAMREWTAVMLSALGWGLQVATIAPVVRHQQVAPVFSLLLPVAAIVYAYMTTVSAWRHFRRQPVRWRDAARSAEG